MQSADILPFPPITESANVVVDTRNKTELSSLDLKTSIRLHENLEISDVLDAFLTAITKEYAVGGLRLILPDGGEQITLGRLGKRDCDYRIQHSGENLGCLTMGNVSALDHRLSTLLSLLPAPLYNALKYYRAKQLARKDSLTLLGNRLAMETAFENEVARAQRFGQPFTMLIIDIDKFKRINDTYGHSAGDVVIRRLADEIQQSLRPYDQGFRYGGEEFVVLLSQTVMAKGLQIAERIRMASQARRLCEAGGEAVTVSIGGAEFRCEDDNLSQLFERADAALYQAKRQGRNQVRTG